MDPETLALQGALGGGAPPTESEEAPEANPLDDVGALIAQLMTQFEQSRDPRIMSLLVKLLQLQQQAPGPEPQLTFPAGDIQER